MAARRLDPRCAVGEEANVCLGCGRALRQLTNAHLLSQGLTGPEYQREYGYHPGRALMCHALRRRGGARPIRFEELLRRREIQRQPRTRWDRRDGSGRFARAAAGPER